MNKINSWIVSYSNFVVKWRWLVLILALLVGLGAASGARFLGFNNDYRVFFSDDNPQLQAFEKMQKTYTKIDNVLIGIAPKDGRVFTQDTLDAVEKMTAEAWKLPFALRVDSISNFQYSRGIDDDLIVEDLVEGGKNFTQEELDRVKKVALNEPFLINQLINKDASVTGINITFQMPQKSNDEAPIAVTEVRKMVAEIEKLYDVDIHLTGVVVLSNAFFEASMSDMGTLVPIMYLIIVLVTFLLLRSISATFTTFVVIVLSMMSGMGIAGYLGILLTPPSSAATTIIMTLAVADSIHLLITMFSLMRKGHSKNDAIKESLRINFGPVFLTSVTTAIGFLSMNASDAPPFHDLGNITAIGVMMAFILSVTLLPALMAILPAKARGVDSKLVKSMESLSEFIISKQKRIFVASIVASSIVLSFVTNNNLEDNFVEYFDKSTEFRQDSDFINENLTGVYQVQYSLDSKTNNGASNPKFLSNVEEFTGWLRSQPEVRHVNTITDTFKRLNKNMHGDNLDYYNIPQDKELSAQFLLLYELSLPYGLDLNNQLNINKSSTQLVVTLENSGTKALKNFSERGSKWWEQRTGDLSYGVGPTVMFAYISERNINSMLVGTLSALVVISLLIMFALRSVKMGFISLIPNLLPAGLAFGIWGITIGEVNVAVSMVTGMTLGIVVDDTVHFLSKYLRARREQNMSAQQAVTYAFSTVGVAIVTTSVILVAGFMVLAQSTFGMNSSMALLTAIAIGMALLADFFLLPVLLLKLDNKAIAKNTNPLENLVDDLEEKLEENLEKTKEYAYVKSTSK